MSTFKFLFYAVGINVCYLYFGILQEKITRTKHEPGSEKFTCTKTLVLLQCIINALFARFILRFVIKQGIDRTRASYYGICSLTYLIAMVSSNMALQHVNYPTQVIGKSCKPIPIMILGVLLGKKVHAFKKYLFVLLIVLGVTLFMYKKDLSELFKSPGVIQDRSSESYLSSIGIGELLLILSLTMDGFTGAVQERMKADHQTKSVHMMYKMNLWSTFYLLVICVGTGEVFEFYSFVQRHPSIINDLILFSTTSAIGQLFIFLTVAGFGPLPCSILTTTRKFFTVLISVFLFNNTMTKTQWIGASLVFIGLTLDAAFSKGKPKVQEKHIGKKVK